MNITEKKFYDNISIIKEMIKNNQPKSEICRLIKVKQSTLNKYLIKYDMWYKGNSSRKGFSHIEQETSYKEYTENGKYINASSLRKKLIKQGVKEEKCENCGLSEWMNKPIPLELHHIDCDRFNNDLGNLKILCSNCHMQEHNYNNKKKPKKIETKKKPKKLILCKNCNNEFYTYSNQFCSQECKIEKSRLNIPNKTDLLDKFKELKTFVSVGKFYDVSDNAVRKWCKKYKILDIVKTYRFNMPE